jgi:hypothetical protein
LVQRGDAVLEFCRNGRLGTAVPDLYEDKRIACREVQADRRLPVHSPGRLHAIGNKLGDEQLGRIDINREHPFPEHLPGVQARAGHRSGKRT